MSQNHPIVSKIIFQGEVFLTLFVNKRTQLRKNLTDILSPLMSYIYFFAQCLGEIWTNFHISLIFICTLAAFKLKKGSKKKEGEVEKEIGEMFKDACESVEKTGK